MTSTKFLHKHGALHYGNGKQFAAASRAGRKAVSTLQTFANARQPMLPIPGIAGTPKAFPHASNAPDALVAGSSMPRVLVTDGSFSSQVASLLKILGAKVELFNQWNSDEALEVYGWATHILIPGGADIDPAYYNEPVTYAHPGSRLRDSAEALLVDLALNQGKPLMGICRGHQMIAAMAGGALWQDVNYQKATTTVHEQGYHAVNIRPRSRLDSALGKFTGPLMVNSYHHQAVKSMPKGWKVAALSSDGIIESIEHPALPVVSVQWHPEVLHNETATRLFEYFLSMKPVKAGK